MKPFDFVAEGMKNAFRRCQEATPWKPLILLLLGCGVAVHGQTVNIACGSTVDYTGTDGKVWQSDRDFTGGDRYTTSYQVSGTPDSNLYRWSRVGYYGDFSYSIPVPNGNYKLTLKFAEIQYWAPGQRVFNVLVNGVQVLTNFDIVAQVGSYVALDQQFSVPVTNGSVQILVHGVTSVGILSAIQVAPDTSGPPGLQVSSSSLSFAGSQGGTNPASQVLAISNNGAGSLNWTAAKTQSWLNLSTNSGTTPASVTIGASTAGLVPGTYTDTVTVASAGAAGSPQSVAVTLTVNPPVTTSFVKLDSTTLGNWRSAYGGDGYDFLGDTPSLPSYAQVGVAGASTFTWSGSTTDSRALQYVNGTSHVAATWYAASSFSFDINMTDSAMHQLALYATDYDNSGRSQRVDVLDAVTGTVLDTRTMNSFVNGQYLVWNLAGHVTVLVTRIAGANAVVSGLFFGTASPPPPPTPILSLSANTASFSGLTSGSNPASQTVNISNTGGGALSWSASKTQSWLTLSTASGTAPAGLTLSASIAGLSAGTYNDTVTITAAGATGSPKTVAVALTVSSQPPTLSVSQTTAGFSATAGGSNPASQTVNITNTGGGTLNWSAGKTQSWLTLSAASGTAPASLSLSASIAGLSAGTYNDVVTITAAGATGSPQTVAVTLTVTAPSSTSALFIGFDTTHQGNWKGVYGSDGYSFVGDTPLLPAYVQMGVSGALTFIWSGGATETRALQYVNGTSRVAATWYAASTFSFDLNLTDGATHQLALYATDYDSSGRAQRIDVVDSVSGTVLDSRTMSSFVQGQYLIWNLQGHVVIRVTRTGGPNAVVSGLFFGPAGLPPPSPPVLSLSAASAVFSATTGGSNPSSQGVNIANAGGGTLSWTAAKTQPWLTLSASSGTAPSTLTLSPSIAGLAAGTYSDTVTVTAAGASGSPQTVGVTLTVVAPPALNLSLTSMSFSGTGAGDNSGAQSVGITNVGGGTLAWTASKTQSWVTLSVTSGTTPGNLSVGVVTAGLTPGTYNDTVTIAAPGAIGSPKTVAVALTVASAVMPVFTPPGGSYIGQQSVTIGTATTGASIHYTTDGSTPSSTVGIPYSGPVSVGTNTTLKAVAYNSGLPDSPVATASYTIASGGWPNGYSYRRTITIDHTKVPNSDQANFPVLVSGTYAYLATTGNGGSVTNANGYDVIFTLDPAGSSVLPFERESYSASSGKVAYWVKVPTVSHTADTVVYMFYGNSSVVADSSNKTAVWDSNYKLVYHMADNAANPAVADASANANNTINTANTNGKSVASQISTGIAYAGGPGDQGISSAPVTLGGAATFSLWFKAGSFSQYARLLETSYATSYYLGTNASGTQFYWIVNGGSGVGCGDSFGAACTSTALTTGTWYHIAGTFDGITARIYLNGSQQGADTPHAAPANQALLLYLNAYQWGGYHEDGTYDEVRVSNIARSSDWIATEFANQNAPSSFLSVGEPALGNPITPVLSLTTSTAGFAATAGLANPSSQSVGILNTGGGVLNWTASKTQSWLTLSATSGTAPSNLVVGASIAGLSAGTYNDTVTIAAPGVSGSPQTVAVTLIVAPQPPALDVSTWLLTFAGTAGGDNPVSQDVVVENTGGGNFNWTASKTQSWLTLSVTSGSAPATLSIGTAIPGLPAGIYSDTVTINAPGISGSPKTITVSLTLAAPVTQGPIANWTFDASTITGNAVLDTSGNGINGTIQGAVTPVADGKSHEALSFDGSTGYILTGSDPRPAMAGELTLAAWIKTTNSGRVETILSKYNLSGSEDGYIFETTPAGYLALHLGGGNTPGNPDIVDGTNLINDGLWHHVAVIIRTNEDVSFYVDGGISSVYYLTTFYGGIASGVGIGGPALPKANLFTGWMDEVRIYNRALSTTELSQLYGGTVTTVPGGEVLYNGIVMPKNFPPPVSPTQMLRTPYYINNPPRAIKIDLGRQLFVDDFLIDQTTLQRVQHQPVMRTNPVLTPGTPISGGAWFDPATHLYKMWYYNTTNDYRYAYSTDGISWTLPTYSDVLVPGTNEVVTGGDTVWLDLDEPNPARRYKSFGVDAGALKIYVYFSADGIHWTGKQSFDINTLSDRTTAFWNPFRHVWVNSDRGSAGLAATPYRSGYVSRVRFYSESKDLVTWTPSDPGLTFWTGADDHDPPYAGPGGAPPELYTLDGVAYESVMVGLFSWFHPGIGYKDYTQPGPILVEVGVGFSRDGFSWVRPTRASGPTGAFIPASNIPGTWNAYNTQSVGGGMLVVGDELWFYFSARTLQKPLDGTFSTGLATLRRDGFYSMDAGTSQGTLTTRTLHFTGNHLFVNVKDPSGQLLVEVLDADGNVIPGFSMANSAALGVDKTLQEVTWNGANLASLAGQNIKFKFYLTNGSLYSFWVTPSAQGASSGYVAAGGPGFTGTTDTVGAH